MVTLSDDEATLIKSILVAMRQIKVRDIDKALVMLSKGNSSPGNTAGDLPKETKQLE